LEKLSNLQVLSPDLTTLEKLSNLYCPVTQIKRASSENGGELVIGGIGDSDQWQTEVDSSELMANS
jgi:hypothetical protein